MGALVSPGARGQVSPSGAGRLPFAALPHELVNDSRLNSSQVRLAGVLCGYACGKAECWPSVPTLAARLGCCERTVQINLRALETAGWIARRPGDNPTHRVLVLTWRLPVPGAIGCARKGDRNKKETAGGRGPGRAAPGGTG